MLRRGGLSQANRGSNLIVLDFQMLIEICP
jgi:hypothetical protein